MQPAEHQIEAFIRAWQSDFDEELTPAQAVAELVRVMGFIEQLAREMALIRKRIAAGEGDTNVT